MNANNRVPTALRIAKKTNELEIKKQFVYYSV